MESRQDEPDAYAERADRPLRSGDELGGSAEAEGDGAPPTPVPAREREPRRASHVGRLREIVWGFPPDFMRIVFLSSDGASKTAMMRDWATRALRRTGESERVPPQRGRVEECEDDRTENDTDILAFLVWMERNRGNLVEGYISEREELRQAVDRHSAEVIDAVDAIRKAAREQEDIPPPAKSRKK
jgi:hypothetical protein